MKKIKEPLYVKVIKVILSGIAALVVGMVMSISIIAIVNKANPPTKKVDTISSLQTMAPIVTKAAENPDYNNNLNLTNDLNDNSNEQWHFETISTTVDIPTTSL